MAFDDLESSREDGRPVRLYAFSLGAKTWRYTSADEDQTTPNPVTGQPALKWKAVAIRDSGVKTTGDAGSDALTIDCDIRIAPAQMYLGVPPGSVFAVRILEKHDGMVDTVAVYAGEITQVTVPTPGQARITCETFAASLLREGLRLTYSRACPYAVYDEVTCRLPKTSQAVVLRVLDITALTLTLDAANAKADGFFNMGFIEWEDPIKGPTFRTIETHTGNTFTMFGRIDEIYAGLQVTAYPGCRNTPSACKAFGNYVNYGGFEDLPGKSPFDGTPVF